MSGHRFAVDAACDCGVAMSFLIRAGADVAERAADLLRADIRIDVTDHHADPSLCPARQLGPFMAALNMALLRYSAAAHIESNVGVVLGEVADENVKDRLRLEDEARWLMQAHACESCSMPNRDGLCYRCALNTIMAALRQPQ